MKNRRTSTNVLVIRPLLRLAFAENSGLAILGFRHPDADMAQSAQTTWSHQVRWRIIGWKLKSNVYAQLNEMNMSLPCHVDHANSTL